MLHPHCDSDHVTSMDGQSYQLGWSSTQAIPGVGIETFVQRHCYRVGQVEPFHQFSALFLGFGMPKGIDFSRAIGIAL